MSFINFSIHNPVKVAVGVILTVMFGLIALFGTPVQLTPEVIEPQITVRTTWPGASPQEVEREITEEQEEQLKSVEGLQEFKSESSDSLSQITLKFEVGTNLTEAQLQVSNRLNQVRQYPATADEPIITTENSNDTPIAWFVLRPLCPSKEEARAFLQSFPHLGEHLQPLLDRDQPLTLVDLTRIARLPGAEDIEKLISSKADVTKLRRFAEDFLEARLERVPGINNSNVIGGREEEFRVTVDPERLAAHRLTIADLRRALIGQNKDTSAGDIWEGKRRYVVRTIGKYQSPEQVAETILALRDNAPVRVRDVAKVGIGYKKPDGIVRQQGIEGITLNCSLKPGSNVLKVMGPPQAELDLNHDGTLTLAELSQAKILHGDCIRIAVAEMNLTILAARHLEMEQVYDQTDYIHAATELVNGNIITGSILVVIILLIFLQSPRSVLVISLSIPISVIGTFLFVRAFGRTINVISLAGMAFAVGMVVDNAIVVLENIYRKYTEGSTPLEASKSATNEVWGAVLASTLTTLAVFIPVIFVQGQAGQLFRDIAIALSCAVGLSLIVSITVVPTAAARILKNRTSRTPAPAPISPAIDTTSLNASDTTPVTALSTGSHTASHTATQAAPHAAASAGAVASEPAAKSGFTFFGLVTLAEKSVDLFGQGMRQLIAEKHEGAHRRLFTLKMLSRLSIMLFFIYFSIASTIAFWPKMEYLPAGNRNLVFAILIPPPGYNVNQMISIGKAVEGQLAHLWEPLPAGEVATGPRIKTFFFVARGRTLFMGARAEDALRAHELIPILQQVARSVPGMIPVVKQASLFESVFSGGRAIDVEITGPDLVELVGIGQQVFGMCMQEFPFAEGNQMRPIPSLDLSSPEIHVQPRLERGADLGVTTFDLGYSVDALIDGAYAGDYWHEGRKLDLVIYGADEFSRHTQDLASLPISTPSGDLVPVRAVADVTLTAGPEQVNHIERMRSITIQVSPRPDMALETAYDIIETKIRQKLMQTKAFESGQYRIRLSGTADRLKEARISMQGNLLLACIINYLLMAALFESFFYPLVIMLSVLLGMAGGVVGLHILNMFTFQALDTLTMLGFIILIGTVVNNAILLVEQALNHMRLEGMSETDAIVESSKNRIRPIMMTTVTTVLGMLPLVLPNPSWANGRLEWVPGAGSELYRGLGSVYLGGLVISTAFTLILVPISFSLALDLKRVLMRLCGSTYTTETIPQEEPRASATGTHPTTF